MTNIMDLLLQIWGSRRQRQKSHGSCVFIGDVILSSSSSSLSLSVFGVFFLLSLLICLCGRIYLAQVIIVEPENLAAKFNQSRIYGSTAAFGTPYYGQRIAGNLVFFETTGCEDSDYAFESNKDEDSLPTIVMVRRGDCHFVTKVEVAERKVAKAVLVVDSEGSMTTSEDIQKVIMADDGWGDSVKIPSLLIGEVDGLKLIDELVRGEKVIVDLEWDMPKDHSVKMDCWMSPAITQSVMFLKNYAPYAKVLKHKLDFRPHYWILTLPGNFKEMCTDETGRFCGLDPDRGGKTTGKDIMDETVRQLCLWQVTQYLNESDPNSGFYSEKWWNYVSQLPDSCPYNGVENQTLGRNCSYNVMTNLDVNIKQVQKCYEENFESLLTHQLINKAWSPIALMINNWRFSGPLDPEIVTRAVCTGYTEEQEECRRLFHPSLVDIKNDDLFEVKTGFPFWAVVVLSVFGALIGISLSALLFWKCILPKVRTNMRHTIMDEVRKEVSMYERDNIPFTESQNSTNDNSFIEAP